MKDKKEYSDKPSDLNNIVKNTVLKISHETLDSSEEKEDSKKQPPSSNEYVERK